MLFCVITGKHGKGYKGLESYLTWDVLLKRNSLSCMMEYCPMQRAVINILALVVFIEK